MRRSTRAMVLFVHTQILLFRSDFFSSVSYYSSRQSWQHCTCFYNLVNIFPYFDRKRALLSRTKVSEEKRLRLVEFNAQFVAFSPEVCIYL